ncbi:MAG: hypothetical protein HYT70_00565 [Candidatus Aenigmarchaeota archaeon]|nr:hypothetical protein [Candidatus Aenigmarchaeota archaeon]
MVNYKRANVVLATLAGLYALGATACGQAQPADTGRREGEAISDFVETRDGLGTTYNLRIQRNGQEENYSFRTDDSDSATRWAYRIRRGDSVRFTQGDINSLEIAQTANDRVEIPYNIDLIAAIYSEDEQREFHSYAINQGIAKFKAHAFVPGLNGVLEYIVEVPYQTPGQLDQIWENLQRTPAFRIRQGAENVTRHYTSVRGKAPVDHPVKAYRDIDGLLHLSVDSDWLDWITGRDSKVPSRYDRPSRTTPTPTPTAPPATPTPPPPPSPTATQTPSPTQTQTPSPSATVSPTPTQEATPAVPNALPKTGGY